MTRPLVLAGSLVALALGAGSAVASNVAGAACSTQGLAFSSVRVVDLHADGVGCARARDVATLIARDLLHGRSIALSRAESLSVSEQTCTGCRTTTSVSISYATGAVKVALRGGKGTLESPAIPAIPSVPATIPSGPGPVV